MFGNMFGKGMMQKIIMYIIMGPMALMMSGSFSFMDLFMIPAIVPMVKGLLAQTGLQLPSFQPATGGA